MFSYYTSILLLSWITLCVLCILVHENGRITHEDKRLLYLTYLLIAVSALAEWIGVKLNGRDDIPEWMLLSAKCMDYILTPMAGAALVAQMHLKNKWQNAMIIIIVANTIMQLATVFNGLMLTIDDNHDYVHGPLYPAYMAVCFSIVAIVIIQFLLYGKSFRRQNRMSLYAIMFLILAGILLQELLPGGNRTSYIAMTIGAALMFIHYTEFTAMAMDDDLADKQHQLDTDALTGVFSRNRYIKVLKAYDEAGALPDSFASFTIDINGLKQVNDSLGHDTGDELILGAAECVRKVFIDNGMCFRTGGDEFVVLSENMTKEKAELALKRLEEETAKWSGKTVHELGFSVGYAIAKDHPGVTAEGLVRESDFAMYDAKAQYYKNAGIERRRVRR